MPPAIVFDTNGLVSAVLYNLPFTTMPNDQYKYVSFASILLLVAGFLFFRSYLVWIIPPIGVITAYTYYKRLMVFPKEQRWTVAAPTMIGLVMLLLLAGYYRFIAV